MNNLNIINQSSAIILIISISLIFVFVGIYFSKKFLGAWILFGPASAATWGGIGAVIGYSLGTAFPLFILIYLGKKFRTSYPQGKSIIEIIRLRFGPNLYKLILVFSIFYMTIFLIAEVTAVAFLINYISGTELWITSLIVISCSLLYTLYGGLRASLITDNIQFFVFTALLIVSLIFITSIETNEFNFEIINVIPDLAFFSILLKENLIIFSVIVIILAISLTISSIDTLINAISSLVIVDVDKVLNLKNNHLNISKQFVIFLSVIAFFVASKGFSILYLFLIADLFCCAAVLSVFYTFYSKSYDEKNAYVSILIGLIAGLLFFPSPDFSKSILFGIILPMDLAPSYISQSLLFCSFIAATLSPIIAWKLK